MYETLTAPVCAQAAFIASKPIACRSTVEGTSELGINACQLSSGYRSGYPFD